MARQRYQVGDVAVMVSRWTVGGTLTTPSTYALTVRAPSGAESTPTPSETSAGVLSAEVALTEAGVWRYRWTGTGAAAGAEEGSLVVDPSSF